MATTRLAQVALNNNTEVVYIHTRLTVNVVFKIFSEERRLTSLANKTCCSWMTRIKKPRKRDKPFPKLHPKVRLSKTVYLVTPIIERYVKRIKQIYDFTLKHNSVREDGCIRQTSVYCSVFKSEHRPTEFFLLGFSKTLRLTLDTKCMLVLLL